MKQIIKQQSTKAERIFYEALKKLRIPFKHRWLIHGREIDFILRDKVCVEIDGHNQDYKKNDMLIQEGYVPIHLSNEQIYKYRDKIEKWLQIYLTYKT